MGSKYDAWHRIQRLHGKTAFRISASSIKMNVKINYDSNSQIASSELFR